MFDYKKIELLIKENKIEKAQKELSNLGKKYYKNDKYLILRSKIFYKNKLYYIAIDTLLIALQFYKHEEIFELLADIYKTIGNEPLSKKMLQKDIRAEVIENLKAQLSNMPKKNI